MALNVMDPDVETPKWERKELASSVYRKHVEPDFQAEVWEPDCGVKLNARALDIPYSRELYRCSLLV